MEERVGAVRGVTVGYTGMHYDQIIVIIQVEYCLD